MGQIKFMGSLFLIVVFTVAITSYVVNFGEDNNTSFNMGDDSEISSLQSNTQDDVTVSLNEVNGSLTALYESEITAGDETSRTGGQFKGMFGGPIGTVKEIFTTGHKVIFGGEEGDSGFGIILTSLITFITVVSGLYIWKTWAGKNPD